MNAVENTETKAIEKQAVEKQAVEKQAAEEQAAEEQTVKAINTEAKANESASQEKAGLVTLAVDIGGSGVKALLLNEKGEPIDERDRIKTPKPATPEAVMGVLKELAGKKDQFDRVSVGFPGVIRKGVVYTAVNLHPDWREYDLAGEFAQMVGKPVRVANDADLQGMGAIAGEGVELVMTLGTGLGGALFTDGRIVPNLELGHFRFRKGQSYEEQLGRAALKKVGKETWNKRLVKAIASFSRLFNYDRLYVGGGEVKQIEVELPENVVVVSNVLGLIGGIRLWD